MRASAIGLILACAVLASAAASQELLMTAGDLQQLCVGTDHVSENACRIYILGVTQGIAVGMKLAGHGGRSGRPCVPAGISGEELERPLKAKLAEKLKTTPADRDLPASEFIGAALAESFPCHKAGH